MRKVLVFAFFVLAMSSLFAQAVGDKPDVGLLGYDFNKSYTIARGDTLQTIAEKVYGDSQLWAALWWANKDAVNNPDIIEVGETVNLFKLPFAPGTGDPIEGPLMAQAYLAAYERYAELGPEWENQRHWVLLQAYYYQADFITLNRDRILDLDLAWYAQREPALADALYAPLVLPPLVLPPLAKETRITIVHTNDMHARAIPSATELGYNRISGVIKELKAGNPNTLVIDAGDVMHGLPFANLERGASVVKLLNAVGYDYMTTGNHDYNYGFGRLLELSVDLKAKILAANVYKEGMRVFAPWDIRDVGGVRVALFGLASPETLYKTDPKGIEGVEFRDPIAEAKMVVQQLAGQYDLLVLISHLGVDRSSDPTSDKVAEAVPQIDVIIDGHSHSSLMTAAAVNHNATLIASADANGVSMGVVDVVLGTNRGVVSKTARTITPANTANMPSDAEVKTLIDQLTAAQAPMLAEKVGNSSVALEGKREIVRVSETNLGKLIANSMRFATKADVAMIGGGGVRDSIPAGDITKKHVFTVLPFGNYIQTAVLKGSEFKAVIENGVGKLPAADGRFPHFANMSYTLDAAAPAGSRVSNIMIGGVPVVPGKDYVFAAPNFDMNGGDGFTMLTGKKYQDYPSDAEVFMAYVQAIGNITPDNIELKK
jgi:5'-nucleotidase/UDP-sugar diphosphatase